ncbi:hypothetical protein L218DRAFT_948176 [Marasmius fiardii PR-910]|nr:hypothetical protein L218DRAFT_948176 [Marasmius fiardii PR-910]
MSLQLRRTGAQCDAGQGSNKEVFYPHPDCTRHPLLGALDLGPGFRKGRSRGGGLSGISYIDNPRKKELSLVLPTLTSPTSSRLCKIVLFFDCQEEAVLEKVTDVWVSLDDVLSGLQFSRTILEIRFVWDDSFNSDSDDSDGYDYVGSESGISGGSGGAELSDGDHTRQVSVKDVLYAGLSLAMEGK